jgi:hypothetical protein
MASLGGRWRRLSLLENALADFGRVDDFVMDVVLGCGTVMRGVVENGKPYSGFMVSGMICANACVLCGVVIGS